MGIKILIIPTLSFPIKHVLAWLMRSMVVVNNLADCLCSSVKLEKQCYLQSNKKTVSIYSKV